MSSVALRKESVDRNAERMKVGGIDVSSLSARRAWIEIVHRGTHHFYLGVALRKESVDRNPPVDTSSVSVSAVALRKESVDRNGMEINGVSYDVWSLSARRAWIEIAVQIVIVVMHASLSARRAWIEIISYCKECTSSIVALRKESVDRNKVAEAEFFCIGQVALRKESVDRNQSPVSLDPAVIHVALRKESVDRNCWRYHNRLPNIPSLSARRAWIEIRKNPLRIKLLTVALRKESVDRNTKLVSRSLKSLSRSPQGERG